MCVGCPFSQNLKEDLKVLYENEPSKYKAVMFWMKDVYADQGVECDWDEDYMTYYNECRPIAEQRRQEMLEQFKPHFNPKIRKVIK